MTAMTPELDDPMESASKFAGRVVVLYSLIMFTRNMQLSAIQRVLTLFLTKGKATEEVRK